MFNTTNALVLREVRYKEADRILTLLTEDQGKITAKARGALRKSSRTAAATQQLTYSEMTLFFNRGKWTVNEASVKEDFAPLRQDIGKLALGSYFAECLEAFAVEEQPDPPLMQLGLNALYALSRGLRSDEQIKAAFELRLMCLAGYAPDVSACPVCGKSEPEEPVLGLRDGSICCRVCRRVSFEAAAELDGEALSALRYIVSAPAKQLFSFRLPEGSLRLLSRAAEDYLREHAERKFSTLDYWKSVK